MALKISGKAAVRLAAMLSAVLKGQNKSRGAVRLATMLRSGAQLEIFTIPQNQAKEWARRAKQYSILYTMVKDHANDGQVDLIVRAADAPRINRIAERFGIAAVTSAQIAAEPVPEQSLSEPDETLEDAPEFSPESTEALLAEILAPEAPTKAQEVITEILAQPEVSEAEFQTGWNNEPADPPVPSSQTLPETPNMNEAPSAPSSAGNASGAAPETPDVPGTPKAAAEPPSQQGTPWTMQQLKDEWPFETPREQFTTEQLFEINKGVSLGIPLAAVALYARPEFSAEQMEQLREGLHSGLSAEQLLKIADPKYDAYTMRLLRASMRPSVKEAISRIQTEQANRAPETPQPLPSQNKEAAL